MRKKIIIGIVGSRRRNHYLDEMKLKLGISELGFQGYDIVKIVTGDCDKGGDKFARTYAKDHDDVELDVKYKMDPKTGKKLNRFIEDYHEFREICYARNEKIAKEPLYYLFAFVAPDRKGGTENTIKYFKRYHKDWENKLILI